MIILSQLFGILSGRAKWKALAASNVAPPLESGGLNIVDLNTKCESLCLSNFSDFRDDFGSSKWHYLARYFLGNKLAILDNRFCLLTNYVRHLPLLRIFTASVWMFSTSYIRSMVSCLMISLVRICINIFLLVLALRPGALVFGVP